MDLKSDEIDPKTLTQHYEDGAEQVRENYVTPGMNFYFIFCPSISSTV